MDAVHPKLVEIVDSERNYVEVLRVGVEVVMHPLVNHDLLDATIARVLFRWAPHASLMYLN